MDRKLIRGYARRELTLIGVQQSHLKIMMNILDALIGDEDTPLDPSSDLTLEQRITLLEGHQRNNHTVHGQIEERLESLEKPE